MRVFVGGVETVYPARWFFCDPDAQLFPSPHGAEASPWLKDGEVNEAWGEIKGRKTLDRGINPGYPGVCSVGDPQWFIDGHLPASVGQWITPVPTPCCGHVPSANPDLRCPQPPPICVPYVPARLGDLATTILAVINQFNVLIDVPLPYLAETRIDGHFGTVWLGFVFPAGPDGCVHFGIVNELEFFGTEFPPEDYPFFYPAAVSYDPLTGVGVYAIPLAFQSDLGASLTLYYINH